MIHSKKTQIIIAELDGQLRVARAQLLETREKINDRFTRFANIYVDVNDEISLQLANIRDIESRLHSITPKEKRFFFFKRS